MFIKSEWDTLREVIMHRPGIEIDYAMLSPRAFLFERPFSRERALKEHEHLQDMLKENGVEVRLLRDMACTKANSDPEFRVALENKVMGRINFYGDLEYSEKTRNEFAENIQGLDPDTLFNLLILQPSLDVRADERNKMEYPKIFSNIPLANLYFMRDQQAVSSKGVISGRMRLPQRTAEPIITRFIMRHSLGRDYVKEIPEGGFFEGGDYIPCGSFGLIGTGPRTNIEGALGAMNSGMMEHDEVFVVENPRYGFMVDDLLNNMHIDTYFNVASSGTVIGSEILARKASGTLYIREDGSYTPEKNSKPITLYDYIRSKGFNFMPLSIHEQLSYSSNFLTLSDGKILCVNSGNVFRRLVRNGIIDDNIMKEAGIHGEPEEGGMFPVKKSMSEFGIDYTSIELEELTGGYGGAHCMTFALRRS